MRSLLSRLFILATLLTYAACQSNALAFDDGVRTISLPYNAVDSAMNPITGDIVGLDYTKKMIHLHTRADLEQGTSQSAKQLQFSQGPVAIEYKRYNGQAYFLVLCEVDSTIYVVDAKSLELQKKVKLSQPGYRLICSENPSDPYVYWGESSWFYPVSLADEKEHPGFNADGGFIRMSSDGTVLFSTNATGSAVRRFALRGKLNSGPPEFALTDFKGCRNPSVLGFVDPEGQTVFAGQKVFRADLRGELPDIGFNTQCILINRALLCGWSSKPSAKEGRNSIEIAFGSANSLTKHDRVVSIAMNPNLDTSIIGKNAMGLRYDRIHADQDRDALVVVAGPTLALIDPSKLQVPKEPVLTLQWDAPGALTVQQPFVLELQKRNAAASVVGKQIPKGAQIVGNQLTWTPSSEQVGIHELVLTCKMGEFEKEYSLPLEVQQPHIVIPLVVNGIAADAESNRIAVWGRQTPGHPAKPSSPPTHLMLLSPDEPENQPSFPLTYEPKQVLLHKDWIAVTDGASSIDVFRRDKPGSPTKVSVEGNVVDAAMRGDRLMIQASMGLYSVDPNTGKHATHLKFNPSRRPDATKDRLIKPQGFYYDSCLFDEELAPQCFLGTMSQTMHHPFRRSLPIERKLIPDLSPPRFDNVDRARANGVDVLALHGHIATRPYLFPSSSGSLEVRLPFRWNENASTGAIECQYDLVYDITESASSPRNRIKLASGASRWTPELIPLVAGNPSGDLAIVFRNALYSIRFPEAREPQTPLAWNYRQSTLRLQDGPTTSLEHELFGGKPPYRYALVHQHDGISMDATTGLVTIDNRVVQQQCARAFADAMLEYQGGNGDRMKDFVQIQESEAASVAARFAWTKPTGWLCSIPVEIDVYDAAGSTFPIQYCVLTFVDPSEVFRVSAERVLESMQRRSEALEQERRALTGAGANKSP